MLPPASVRVYCNEAKDQDSKVADFVPVPGGLLSLDAPRPVPAVELDLSVVECPPRLSESRDDRIIKVGAMGAPQRRQKFPPLPPIPEPLPQ